MKNLTPALRHMTDCECYIYDCLLVLVLLVIMVVVQMIMVMSFVP
jgi:hypothetical protein